MLEHIPTDPELLALLGEDVYGLWRVLREKIDARYEMETRWDKGYREWAYEYKYRRAGKTLCTLNLKESCMGVLIILGQKERDKFEKDRDSYSPYIQETYDAATTYHDGKWILFEPKDEETLDELVRMLAIKRRPNRT